MKVSIKSFAVPMEVKSNGMELEIRKPDGTFIGDLFVAMSGLTWCKGKTTRPNGIKLSWTKFIKMMEGL